MVEDKAHSTLFGALTKSLLYEGVGFRFTARGRSMQPTIQDGEILHVRPASVETLRKGDIVLFAEGLNYKAHRLLWIDPAQSTFVACGDAGAVTDGAVHTGKILGLVVAKEEGFGEQIRMIPLNGRRVRLKFIARKARARTARLLRNIRVLRGS